MPRTRWKWTCFAVAITLLAGGAFAAGYWFAPREPVTPLPKDEAKQSPPPVCRIEFLSPQERIDRKSTPIVWPSLTHLFDLPIRFELKDEVREEVRRATRPRQIVPIEHASNPVLLHDHFAVVRFENTTGRPLILYVLRWRPGFGYEPQMQSTALVGVELWAEDGSVITPLPDRHQSLFAPTHPSQCLIRENNHPLFLLDPGHRIEYPFSILGELTSRERGLKPGTYTVRVTVTHVEAPNEVINSVTAEPVTITVTEEHIKAAEAYREAYWKAQLERKE